MADQRRFLRPPSAVSVSRKSQSFNAADRNKILDLQSSSGNNSTTQQQQPISAVPAALSTGQTEWRSRSMNAKHSFTYQGTGTPPSAMPSKLAKKSDTGKNISNGLKPSNSPTHLVKVESSSKKSESNGKQKLVKVKSTTKPGKETSSLRSTSSASNRSHQTTISEPSRVARTASNPVDSRDSRLKTPASKTTSKPKSGLMPPRATVSRSASNSSRSSTATTASPDRKSKGKKPVPKSSQPQQKSSTSVLGRLRKMGGPSSTTIPNSSTNGVTLKQAVPVKSPTGSSKPITKPAASNNSTLEKREKKSLAAPSKLTVSSYKGKSTGTKLAAPTANANSVKQQSGLRTLNRALGAKDDKNGQRKSNIQMAAKVSPASTRKPLNSNNSKFTIGGSDVIITQESNQQKRFSGEENVYRRDKIDVQNLKNLLVRPYENVRTKRDEVSIPVLNGNDIDFSDSEDFSKASIDVDFSQSLDDLENDDSFHKTTQKEQISTPVNHTKPNYETGVRNIHLPSSSDERKPQKTATVAPFRRQIQEPKSTSAVQSVTVNPTRSSENTVTNSTSQKPPDNNSNDKKRNSIEKPNQISVNTAVSMEERRKTARGIADLRQNLEETMSTLRNSQLRNRLSDEFERRISAQIDNETIEEIGLPEVPPPLTNGGYRSTGTLSGIHTISHVTRSPKLHAGESLGPGSYTSPRTNKYSSLQRANSNRNTRAAWNDMPEKQPIYKDEKDEISSVSSEDISELITGISTDDISLSSANNSPFHVPKPSTTPLQKSNLARNNSVESLEKSSNSTSESSRSLSTTWKRTKSGSKSDSEGKSSKKKLEKKNSNKSNNEKGSSAVGSRLATLDRSESPTSSPSPQPRRDLAYSYRSLPRTKKNKYNDFDNNLGQNGGQESFVRSPALKILLRSKANKSKHKSNLGDIPDGVSTHGITNLTNTETFSSNDLPGHLSNGVLDKSGSKIDKMGFYSNLENKNLRNYGHGISMSATQSLPRRFARKSGNTTWSSPKPNANSAYSLPVTPDNIYDEYGQYIGNDVPYSESTNSFSNLSVPDYDNFSNAMDISYHDKKSDWPLGGMPASSAIAASSPNVSRAAYSDRNYRTISSTKDLIKRRGSTVSLGGALSQGVTNDETSIAMAKAFLFSLAQNKALHQAHMVQDFEKSLSHLTSRLQELSATADEKDNELKELRNTIEKLKGSSPKSEVWEGKLKKKASCASLSSMSSQASISSAGSIDENTKTKKKRGWLKSSFKSAFGRSKSKANLANGDSTTSRSSSPQKSLSGQEVISLLSFDEENCDPDTVRKLKEELRQKERKLTDIRLEALTSRHQLQHLQDAMSQMKNEMESLRKENEQLQQLGLSAYSLTSSSTFLHSKLNSANDSIIKSISDELRVKIVVEVTRHGQHISINVCPISKAISWVQLDQKLTKIFLGYCQTVDPTNSMKLSKNSIEKYSIGDGVREMGLITPDLLPCGYLVGNTDTIVLKLQNGKQNCVDLLAFELLIDETIAQKYIDLIKERQRVVLCGPIGTGKTLLANRLAGHIAETLGASEPVIYMDAKQKAISELQDFLQSIGNSVERNCDGITIIVLDNMQNVKHPNRILEPFCGVTPIKGLYLICVTNRKSTELQDFCWITWNNNSPPVQTYLARKLRRSYLEHQISQNQKPDNILSLVITWLPKCWQRINDFLELHSGSDVTIGPRMFSSCPMDASSARVWFTDLWNFSVVRYVISAVKRSPSRRNGATHWSDPTDWVLETMPWRDDIPNLLHIRAEDIGPSPTESDHSIAMSQSSNVTSQSSNTSQSSSDPLLNMLMRLQEAANYDSDTSSNHDENFEISIDKALTELGT